MPDGTQVSRSASAALLTLPNVITFGRLCAVPLAFWLVVDRHPAYAFFLFVAAGASDAVDGWLARRWGGNAIGALLDPVADKALLVTMYVTLAVVNELPDWLAILVVFRDLLIVGGVIVLSVHRPARRDTAARHLQAEHRPATRADRRNAVARRIRAVRACRHSGPDVGRRRHHARLWRRLCLGHGARAMTAINSYPSWQGLMRPSPRGPLRTSWRTTRRSVGAAAPSPSALSRLDLSRMAGEVLPPP